MLLRITFICLLFVVPSWTINCPDGFSVLNNNTCYQVISNQATYVDASAQCNRLGGSLISIHNTIDNRVVTNHVTSNVYIGLQCYSASQCQWDDGSATNYTNFYFGIQPDNGNCVTLQMGSGYWFNTPCNTTNSYVCQVKDTCPYSYQGFCYNPHTIGLSESDAEEVCQQECGHLVSIHSNEENSFIRTLFDANTYNYVRIGALFQNNVNSWTDNSSWTYQNIGYQNANFGACYSLAFTNDVVGAGKWISSQCSKVLPFVCKKEIGATCGPTPPPTLAPSQCDGSQFFDSTGYIYSPNYPLSYSSTNKSCTYILSTLLGTITNLYFTDFEIDPTATIALYNSIEDEDPFAVFDYYNGPGALWYNSSSNTMKIVFHSRDTYSYNATYRWAVFFSFLQVQQPTTTTISPLTSTQPPSACGSVRYYVPPASIEFPDVSGTPPADNKCIYSISAGFGYKIRISFGYANMYQGSSVIVYDGASTTSQVLVTVQNGPTGWYNSSSNHMLVYVNTFWSYDNFQASVQTIS